MISLTFTRIKIAAFRTYSSSDVCEFEPFASRTKTVFLCLNVAIEKLKRWFILNGSVFGPQN